MRRFTTPPGADHLWAFFGSKYVRHGCVVDSTWTEVDQWPVHEVRKWNSERQEKKSRIKCYDGHISSGEMSSRRGLTHTSLVSMSACKSLVEAGSSCSGGLGSASLGHEADADSTIRLRIQGWCMTNDKQVIEESLHLPKIQMFSPCKQSVPWVLGKECSLIL